MNLLGAGLGGLHGGPDTPAVPRARRPICGTCGGQDGTIGHAACRSPTAVQGGGGKAVAMPLHLSAAGRKAATGGSRAPPPLACRGGRSDMAAHIARGASIPDRRAAAAARDPPSKVMARTLGEGAECAACVQCAVKARRHAAAHATMQIPAGAPACGGRGRSRQAGCCPACWGPMPGPRPRTGMRRPAQSYNGGGLR